MRKSENVPQAAFAPPQVVPDSKFKIRTTELAQVPNSEIRALNLLPLKFGYAQVPDFDFRVSNFETYQISHRLLAGRTIGSPALHPKALANAGKLDRGPRTRNLGNG